MFREGISRRKFAKDIGSSFIGTSLSFSSLDIFASNSASSTEKKTGSNSYYASAGTDQNNNHYVAILGSDGAQTSKLPLPSRAHQIAINHKLNHLAVAARRPGTYLIIIDASSGKLIQEVSPETGYHFYGHSIFSADGRFLFTSENHIDTGEGRIFVRDAFSNYIVSRSFPSYGIGPHELKIHPDGETIVVANGGIKTHPDFGRTKLNLDTMSPSLVYISIQTGELLEEKKLPDNLHQLSIRHIDINSNGLTAIAMQYQGFKTDNVPLIAVHERGKRIKTLWAPDYINRKLKQYCGSVCFNEKGNIFVVSSPRGNTLTIWDANNAEFIANIDCLDVCGISQSGDNGFTISNGFGEIYRFDIRQPILKPLKKDNTLAWDNHLTLI